jgi:D-alanine--poly(phosphoribitol) ligase subunit 2
MSESTGNGAGLDARIRGLFLDALSIEVDSVDTNLIESGLLDSLVLVELLLHLEEEFGIDVMVAELDIEDFRTVRSIGTLVTHLRRGEAVG